MTAPCVIDGCSKPSVARGICGMHYRRQRLTGTTDARPSKLVQADFYCSVVKCLSHAKSRGLCNKHYQVERLHGDPSYLRPTAQSLSCTIDGCENRIHSKGLCCMHYRRNRINGTPDAVWLNRGPKVCTVAGCEAEQRSRTYCSAHYQAWQKHGDAAYVRPETRGIDIPHGTLTGYGWHGCRCVECKKVQATANRQSNLLAKYGITTDEYDRLLDEQGGVCAICRLDSSSSLRGKLMAVDHCHDTGKVRGLLCSPCNTGIGHLKDDPDRLMAAAAYLLQSVDVLGAISIADASGTGVSS